MTCHKRSRTILPAISVAVIVATVWAPSLIGQEPVTELEGVWLGESTTRAGQERRVGPEDVRFTFARDKFLAVGLVGRQEVELHFKVGPTGTPRTLDYGIGREMSVQGIYELKDGLLIIALPRPGGARPKSVDPNDPTVWVIFKLRKRKAGY